MAKAYDVVAVIGEYTNKQGEKKKQYLTIGSVIEGEKGMSLKLNCVPTGWDGWAGLYVPKEQVKQETRSDKRNDDDLESSIPF